MSDLKDSFWGCIFFIILAIVFAAIVFPLLYLRTTFVYRPIIFAAFPMLVIAAWNGYPLAYYKLTGRRFIRHLDPSFSEDYQLIEGRIYRHRGYDKETMQDKSLTPEQRGYEPYEQRHEYLIFRFYAGGDTSVPPRFRGELSPQDKRNQRFQTFCRLLFILLIIALSEAWLNGLGTSWRRIFDHSP